MKIDLFDLEEWANESRRKYRERGASNQEVIALEHEILDRLKALYAPLRATYETIPS